MLTAGSGPKIARFFARLQARRTGALLLDYDGTLAPFRADRLSAIPYDGVRSLLGRIMAQGLTRVVLISGRPAHEVQSLLGIDPSPEIWGVHGLERLRGDGSNETAELAVPESSALAEADSWLRSQGLGDRVEAKSGSLAVHWRGIPESIAREIHRKVSAAWRPLVADGKMAMLEFDGGIELRPARGNKGDAILAIMNEVEPATPIAYLGDDLTDEDAFRALAGHGLSVLVRSEWRETGAQAWIRPPAGLLAFLENWLRCLGGIG